MHQCVAVEEDEGPVGIEGKQPFDLVAVGVFGAEDGGVEGANLRAEFAQQVAHGL